MAGELISGEVMDAATQRKGIKEKFIKSLFKPWGQRGVVKASPNVRRGRAKRRDRTGAPIKGRAEPCPLIEETASQGGGKGENRNVSNQDVRMELFQRATFRTGRGRRESEGEHRRRNGRAPSMQSSQSLRRSTGGAQVACPKFCGGGQANLGSGTSPLDEADQPETRTKKRSLSRRDWETQGLRSSPQRHVQ